MRSMFLRSFGRYFRMNARSGDARRPGLRARRLAVEPLEVRAMLSVLSLADDTGLSLADDTGDQLWNWRKCVRDRDDNNNSWILPWRGDHEDGWGRFCGEIGYDFEWGQNRTTGNADGSFYMDDQQDCKLHLWTYVYIADPNGKNILLKGNADAQPRVFFDYDIDCHTGKHFPATLPLHGGWNRIDVTAHNEINRVYVRVDSPLATMVDQMDHNPPHVAVDKPSVTVDEGQTAHNTGTYFFPYPGNDTVTLSLRESPGTVIDNGDGTWTWSFDTTDGPDDSQTVTIRATDSDGAWDEATFQLEVKNVAPSVAADNQSVTVDAGQTAVNTGTYFDPGDDTVTLTALPPEVHDNGDGTWSWSLSTTGSGQSGPVTIKATDSDGAHNETTFQLVVNDLDFGDAPDDYSTLLADDGARHVIVPELHLGSALDEELDGQPGPAANGDDRNHIDDEDGVDFCSPLARGRKAQVNVVASVPGRLDAWIDFNRDADWLDSWSDADEHVFADVELDSGLNVLRFDVPALARPGRTYARFRFSSAGGLSFDGRATDGEVEDYCVLIARRGDADLDGDVDPADLARFALYWDPPGENPDNTWEKGDFDGDGAVGPSDLAYLAVNWAPAGYAMPCEPVEEGGHFITAGRAGAADQIHAGEAATDQPVGSGSKAPATSPGKWDWLCEFDATRSSRRPSKRERSPQKAADVLLTAYWP